MPGAQCARSLAGQKKQAMPVTVTTVTPEITRHSPHNGFTVSFVLSPVTGLFATVANADNSAKT